MKNQFKLVGSANSLPRLGDLINKHWHWTGFSFIQQDDNVWLIQQHGKYIQGVRVVLKKNRFCFEMEIL